MQFLLRNFFHWENSPSSPLLCHCPPRSSSPRCWHFVKRRFCLACTSDQPSFWTSPLGFFFEDWSIKCLILGQTCFGLWRCMRWKGLAILIFWGRERKGLPGFRMYTMTLNWWSFSNFSIGPFAPRNIYPDLTHQIGSENIWHLPESFRVTRPSKQRKSLIWIMINGHSCNGHHDIW